MRQPTANSSLATLVSSLLLACAGAPDATAPAEPAPPSLGAERVVVVNAFQMGGDPSNPLALQVAFDADLTAQDICTGNFSPDQNQGSGQAILTPSGGLLQHSSGREVDLVLYQFGEGPVTGPCDLVGAPVLGIGTGKFTFPFVVAPGGTIVAHVTVQGTVALLSGGHVRVLGTARVTVLPDGTLLFDEERVVLTPL